MKFGVCLTHYGRKVESAELLEAYDEFRAQVSAAPPPQ